MRRCICEERPFALTSARAVAQEISANLHTCSPFTLRVASIHHPSMTSEHESMLREAASKLRVFLQASGVTGHPILAAPDTLDLEALHLGQKGFCTEVQLGTAIEQCLPSTEWQLFVCRYGLKTEAGAFFGKLEQAGPTQIDCTYALGDFQWLFFFLHPICRYPSQMAS